MQTPQPNERPRVGVGCIVSHNDRFLLVRSVRGYWSTPGGNLELGEDPVQCAQRETLEETGVDIVNMRFVGVTSDIVNDTGRHYITIWIRGDATSDTAHIADTQEIAEIGWYRAHEFPEPRFRYLENMLARRCMPNPPLHIDDFPHIST